MTSVWKYTIGPFNVVQMPHGATFRHFGMQGDVPTAWFEVDTTRHVQTRTFQVFGTGHSIPANAEYLGTTMMDDPYVWHLYEILR